MCCQTTFGNDFQQKTAWTTFNQNNLVVKSDSDISNLRRFVERAPGILGGMNFEVPRKFKCRIFSEPREYLPHLTSSQILPIGSILVYWPTWRVDFMENVHCRVNIPVPWILWVLVLQSCFPDAPPEVWHSPWKMEVGRRLSYWKVTFQGLC